MKQRLLLCLLMLMVSVGVSWAADELKLHVLAGKTITVSATGGKLNYNKAGLQSSVSFTAQQEGDYNIDMEQGVTSLTINGEVTNCILSHAKVTTLTFTGNGKLVGLDASKATALTVINADGNQLSALSKPATCVLKGNQTLDASTISGNANAFDVINTASSLFSSILPTSEDYKVDSWMKLNAAGTYVSAASEVKNIATTSAYPGNVAFVGTDGYYTSGTYACKITRGDASVTLQGIVINPAEITLTIEDSPKDMWGRKMGEIQSTGISVANCVIGSSSHSGLTFHQGDQIQVTATAEANYVFDKFVFANGGLDGNQPSSESSMSYFTIKAKPSANDITKHEPVKIQALFKGKPCTINYVDEVRDGSFTVQKVDANDNPLATLYPGVEVEYGDRLLIQATPSDKYYPTYTVNAQEPEQVSTNNTKNADFKVQRVAYVDVTGNLTLNVQFQPNSVDTKYSFVLVSPEDKNTNWNGVFYSITAEDNKVKLDGSVSQPTQFNTQNPKFTAAKNIPMTLELVDNHKVDYVIQSIQLGSEQTLDLTEETPGKYVTSFNAPEEGDAVFTITVTKRSAIGVYVPKSDGTKEYTDDGEISDAQTYVYDNTPKAFQYTTNPANLTLTLKYAPSSQATNDGAYTTEAPKNAGKYAVKYSYKSDGQYAGLNETSFTLSSSSSKEVLIIEPATAVISTIPTVTVEQKEGKYVYTIGTNGVVKALGATVDNALCQFEVINAPTDLTPVNVEAATAITEITNTDNQTKSHNVYLRLKIKTKEGAFDSNYAPVAVQTVAKVGNTDVDKVKVTIQSNPEVKSIKILNGATEIANGSEVAVGTKIKLQVAVDNYGSVSYKAANATGQPVPMNYVSGNIFESPVIDLQEAKEYIIILADKLENTYKMSLKGEAQSVVYSGEAKAFDVTSYLTIMKGETDVTAQYKDLIYYKDEAGNVVKGAPVNADIYDVCLDIPMNITDKQPAITLVVENAFQITEKAPKVTWPTSATMIGKGQALVAAQFKGGSADVPGTFSWETPNETNLVSGHKYNVTFTPSDPNYKAVTTQKGEYEDAEGLAIVVSSNPVVSIATVANGYFEVKAVNGGSPYLSGNQIVDGTEVIITAVPNEDFEVESMTLDICGEKRSISSGYRYKIDGKSILVTGSFRVIQPEAPDPEIDPNTQYIVTLPGANDVRGAIINNPGKNGVKFNQPFSFSISTLAADAKNLVVKANGVTLTPTSAGTYRLASVTGNTTVTVSLANPTELKVNIPREYKNAKDYLVGKVQVEGPADGKCYYGDQITLVAYPESGVSFTRWSDGNREQLREMTVTKDLTLKAEFSGTPTGIEDIESAGIYAGNGYIQVKNVANADLTVVSISGRIQTRQHLDGDVQVRVPAGVYIVVLESGQDVKRVKVIVR